MPSANFSQFEPSAINRELNKAYVGFFNGNIEEKAIAVNMAKYKKWRPRGCLVRVVLVPVSPDLFDYE
jgi:hypothetical protein